jgi:hypothetical protein
LIRLTVARLNAGGERDLFLCPVRVSAPASITAARRSGDSRQ